jgi:O-antigen/teichoic acid export membrane protein
MSEDGQGSLARGGALLAVASVLANALGYAFTVVLARAYGPAEYGAFGALLGLGLIGGIPSGALQYVLARRTAAGRLSTGRNERAGLLLSLAVGGTLAVLVVGLSPVAAAFLHLDNPWPAVWLGATLLPYTVSGALLGALLGHERYAAFGLAQVLMAAARFGAAIAAGLGGLSVSGTLAALAGATTVASGLLWWLTGPGSWRRTGRVDPRGLVGDLARSCSAIAGIVVLSSLDLLLARHYLPGAVSGTYALASLFAKAALWGAQFVPTVVFPRLSAGGHRRRLLVRAALVTAAVGAGCVLVAWVAGGAIVRTVAGAEAGYRAAAALAVPFAVLGTLWALVQLALLAAVAAGDPRPGRLLWVAVTVEAAVVALGPHRSPGAILAACLLTTGLLVVGGIVLDLRGAPAASARIPATGRADRIGRAPAPAAPID